MRRTLCVTVFVCVLSIIICGTGLCLLYPFDTVDILEDVTRSTRQYIRGDYPSHLYKAQERLEKIASQGDIEQAKKLLFENGDIILHISQPRGDSALEMATKANQTDMVRFLLEQGARPQDTLYYPA